ncbi:RNA recognition domain-containing protein [Apiospora marii]|uniref:RNA recognition domain-containing protein n=1 Tax=Apiospora marii TaxID=335849 RepID=UPI0031319B8C
MPPQIKQDLNRSGWETTDFPSVCESCLPDNPYVKMLKEDYGAECKLCTRPFTIFSWSGDRAHGRKKRTNICLTCARLKNCCQCCMLDLSFGLPIAVRDAALKMVAPGPGSEINREYFAQNMEKEIEEGRGGTEEYEKADEKGRELLRKLAASKPYFRKGRAIEDGSAASTSGSGSGGGSPAVGAGGDGRWPSRQQQEAAVPLRVAITARSQDWQPPSDKSIMSLFVTGVEDDLPEYKLRDFFKVHGKIKSLVCSHMSHCAFVNYETRASAEKAAEACQGRAVISGCPLRVRWSVPRAVGTMNKEQRGEMIRDGRSAFSDVRKHKAIEGRQANLLTQGGEDGSEPQQQENSLDIVAAPPGADDINYASLAGN